MKNKERYVFGGYKYAPESIGFTLNGKLLNLPCELKQSLQYKAACGKHEEVINELKRFVRKARKKGNIAYVTYGFYGESKDNYYFTKELLAKPDELDERVRVYKEAKHSLQESVDYYHTGYSCTTGEISPYGSVKKSVEEFLVKLDLSRPVKVKFLLPAIYQ